MICFVFFLFNLTDLLVFLLRLRVASEEDSGLPAYHNVCWFFFKLLGCCLPCIVKETLRTELEN